MSDITKCAGYNPKDGSVCPKRETCYRYTAPVDPLWQSWFAEYPYSAATDGVCELYVRTRKDAANSAV